jgi:hypothetical protein
MSGKTGFFWFVLFPPLMTILCGLAIGGLLELTVGVPDGYAGNALGLAIALPLLVFWARIADRKLG